VSSRLAGRLIVDRSIPVGTGDAVVVCVIRSQCPAAVRERGPPSGERPVRNR
jgi:hypothetical protein